METAVSDDEYSWRWQKRHTSERKKGARSALRNIRDQISSGELVVRQMTASERRRWDERSAASDLQATPEERTRRDAARKKRRDRDKRSA
jgi:hypothetical protein